MTAKLWIVQATAVAGVGCQYPLGEKHPLLMFAAALDRDAALHRTSQGAAEHGWGHIDIIRSGEIANDTDAIQDDMLRSAATTAVEGGCAIIAYDQPMPHGPEADLA